MYDAVFKAFKEELERNGVFNFPPGFRMIADWEAAEVWKNK